MTGKRQRGVPGTQVLVNKDWFSFIHLLCNCILSCGAAYLITILKIEETHAHGKQAM